VLPLRRLPFDLDAGGFRAGQRVQFFHPHARGAHAGILEAGLGDAFRERFGEIDMSAVDDGADLRVIAS
jgi:hypothetical protein